MSTTTGSYAGTGPLLRLAWRRDRWIIVVSVLALVAAAYGSMAATLDLYPTDAEASAAAQVMTDTPSLAAVYGPLTAPTRAGVGVLKTVLLGGLFLAFLAFALVRRHTRTEEEEGRHELVAAGIVGRRAPLAASVILAGAVVVVTAVLGGLSIANAGLAGALALTVAWLVCGLVMVGITAVAVQLTQTTRGAGGIALGVLGISYLIRAAADTTTGGGRHLVWLSFLGWGEKAAPYGANRYWVLLPALVAVAVLLAGADALLHRRDLGSGLWASRPGPATAAPRLSSSLGLAWRLQRGSLIGWSIAYAVLGLVVGSLASSVDQIANTPSVEDMLRKMSGGQGTMTEVFFGTELRFAALGAAAYGIATALRLRSEESAGRAELVLATPVPRLRWLAGHVGIALLGSTWLMALLGLAAGLSASAAGSLGVAALLPAALATLPAVWVCVALTVLIFGVLPVRSTLAWALLAVFLLLGELGALLKLPSAVIGLSPFGHLGSLPGGDADLVGLVSLVVVAAVVGVLGALTFRRRDLTG